MLFVLSSNHSFLMSDTIFFYFCHSFDTTDGTTAFTAWVSYNMQTDDFDMTNFNVIQDCAIISIYELYSHSSVHTKLCGLPCCSCTAKPTWSFKIANRQCKCMNSTLMDDVGDFSRYDRPPAELMVRNELVAWKLILYFWLFEFQK
jgi:hypothetical protein